MGGLPIAFVDFWPNFDPERNALTDALRSRREVDVVAPKDALLLFYSKHGHNHRSFVGTKVFVTAENLRPRWNDADFCIGHDHCDDPRYLRFPYWAFEGVGEMERPLQLGAPTPWAEREFCACIYSYAGSPERSQLYDALDSYRPITSAGKFRKNVDVPELAPREGDWRASKIDYLQRFRFVIACENSSHPGYTTEKLYDAMLAGAIPVYWGDPDVAEDFDDRTFVRWDGVAPIETVIEQVKALDGDPDAAQALTRRAPATRVDLEVWAGRLASFLDEVATVAAQRPNISMARRRALRLVARHGLARGAQISRHRVAIIRRSLRPR